MKTKKEIESIVIQRLEKLSYDIAYYRHKGEVIAKENCINKFNIIKELAHEFGIEMTATNKAFNAGYDTFIKDLNS